MRSVALGVLLLGVIAAAPPQIPASKPDDTWPPPGVEILRPGIGITSPRLLREVKPIYTPDALRANIQGNVTLQCVVQIDGSVGAIHVAQSLDPKYGLDNAAIAALKQWRFAPATKDGVAVPVIVTVELSFTQRLMLQELTWPAGFEEPASASPGDARVWHDDTTEIAGLRIRVEYPAGWTLRRTLHRKAALVCRSSMPLTSAPDVNPWLTG